MYIVYQKEKLSLKIFRIISFPFSEGIMYRSGVNHAVSCWSSLVGGAWSPVPGLTGLASQLQVRWRWHKDKVENRYRLHMGCFEVLGRFYASEKVGWI